jgi:hypothetical protein
MKNKSRKTMRGPTVQVFEMVPITDPVELAAIDRRRKAAEKAMAAAERTTGKKMLGRTLQELEMVEITDPAEQAEFDRRCREAEKAMAAAERSSAKRKSPKRK